MQAYTASTESHGPILITGASGFLGCRIAATLGRTVTVYCPTHRELDITSLQSIRELFSRLHPDVVIHCAAISDTGYTQCHPLEAYQINVLGTAHVAQACQEIGAKLLYMSSDQVYNGCDRLGPLSEDCPLGPESEYGIQKLQCEEAVSGILPEAVGLRLTWMYDAPDSPLKNAGLLMQLSQMSALGGCVPFASREFRGITNVKEIVHAIPALFDVPGGVYNCGAGATGNTYQTALAAARLMKLPAPEKLVLQDALRYPDHPRNLSMDCSRLSSLKIHFSDTLEGLKNLLS